MDLERFLRDAALLVGAGLVRLATQEPPSTPKGAARYTTPNNNTMIHNPQNPGEKPDPIARWSLEYKLKSTNYLQEPTIIFKFGGSAFRAENWEEIVVGRLQQLLELHKNYRIILTTGGGKVQEQS